MRTDRLDDLEHELIAMISASVVHDEPIEADTELLLSGLVDSIGVIRIVSWIEDHLEIEIDPVDVVLENFQSVAAMVDHVTPR